jgi:hypothetical protein
MGGKDGNFFLPHFKFMLLFILGLLTSTIILCLYFIPKIKKVNIINKEIQQTNEEQFIYNQ